MRNKARGRVCHTNRIRQKERKYNLIVVLVGKFSLAQRPALPGHDLRDQVRKLAEAAKRGQDGRSGHFANDTQPEQVFQAGAPFHQGGLANSMPNMPYRNIWIVFGKPSFLFVEAGKNYLVYPVYFS
jgi:hypothetical protein